MTPAETIAELLEVAGHAHHDAFAHANGHDPEWPAWYANHLLPDLAGALGVALTHEELADALARLDAEHRANPTDDAWNAYFARQLLARYPAAD